MENLRDILSVENVQAKATPESSTGSVGHQHSQSLSLLSNSPSSVHFAMSARQSFIFQIMKVDAFSPPALSLWDIRHFSAFYYRISIPLLSNFMAFPPAERIRMAPKEQHTARILFIHSVLPVPSSPEHFPAAHEAKSPSVALPLFLSLVGNALCLNVLEAISVSRG